MSDTLPPKPLSVECGVVNLDNSKTPGTHWICYRKQNNKLANIFDSFGGNPPRPLLDYLSGVEHIEYSAERLQNFEDSICGHLCLAVLKLLSDGFSFGETLQRIKLNLPQ